MEKEEQKREYCCYCLYNFLRGNKRRIKKIRRFDGLYVVSLLSLYSCKSDDADASVAVEISEGEMKEGTLFTDGNDYKDYEGTELSYMLDGMDGEDIIKTGDGNDAVRGGLGKDDVQTGGGNDVILLVGETKAGEYEQEEVEDILSLILNVDGAEGKMDDLNNRYQSEVSRGEVIDGGAGEDAVVVYGDVDLRGLEMKNVEMIRMNSGLILTEKHLVDLRIIRGVGDSYLRIEASDLEGEVEFNLEGLDELSGIKSVRVGMGVKLIVSSELGLKILNGIGRVEGEGYVEFRGEGGAGLTALELFESGKDVYAEEFIKGEQLLVEGRSLRKLLEETVLVGEAEREFADYVEAKTVKEVFVLKEGENMVELGGYSFSEGAEVLRVSSDDGFVINELGELSSVVRDYETEEQGVYFVSVREGTEVYRVKILLLNVNEEAEITGDLGGSVGEVGGGIVKGRLNIADEDGSAEEAFFSGNVEGKYGFLDISKEGEWVYYLEGDHFRVKNLIEGETLTDNIEVSSVGGTRQVIGIVINGSGESGERIREPRIELLLEGEGFVGEELFLNIRGDDLPLLEGESYEISWFRGGDEILGESGESYVLSDADLGEEIRARLSLGRLVLESESKGEVLVKSFSPIIGLMGGGFEVGGFRAELDSKVLIVGTSDFLDLEDFDYEIQWYSDGELLEGETGEVYELSEEDGGKVIKVGVLLTYKGDDSAYEDAMGYGERESEEIEYLNIEMEGEIIIEGEEREGENLFVNIDGLSDEDGLEDALYVYQWYRNEVAIEGAVHRSYVLEEKDVGKSISVSVEIIDDEGHREQRSLSLVNEIEDVNNPALGRVKIVGIVNERERIRANVEELSDEDGLDVSSYEYQWYKDGEAIEGETGEELFVEEGWLGASISVGLSFMDVKGNEYEKMSVSREVYAGIVPIIRTMEMLAIEGEVGFIGGLEVDFFGEGVLSFRVPREYERVLRVDRNGEVYVLLEQDYELNESLSVVVSVRSEADFSSSQEITIFVRNVDDESPEGLELVEADPVGVVVELEDVSAEEGAVSLLGTLSASDVDTDTSVHSLSYRSDDVRFMIEETSVGSGVYVLKAIEVLDYEGEEVVEGTTMVEVIMEDRQGNMGVESLTVTVTDVDDEAPENIRLFDDGGDEIRNIRAEEGSMDLVLGTLRADDVDTDIDINPLSYTIDGTDDRFLIEETASGSGIYVLKAREVLDYEDGDEVVNGRTIIRIIASDVSGNETGESLRITVTDVDDELPTMLRLVDDASEVAEDVTVVEGDVGFVLGTLTAEDVDTEDADLVYTVDDLRFMVEETASDSGIYVLRAGDMVDYEGDGVSDGTTVVELTVYDGATETVVESLTITITDVNDELPMMLRLVDDVGDVVEDVIVVEGDVVVLGTLTADDVDTVGDLTYTIDDLRFEIEETASDSGTYVLRAGDTVDYEGAGVSDGTTVVELTVYDGATETVIESLTITITDVNDNEPTMLRLVDGAGDVVEDVTVVEGDVVVLGTLTADDVDTVGDLTYRIDDNMRFMVENTVDGYVLKSKDTIDYEGLSDGTVVIGLTVDDGVNETVVESLTVTVTDVDDESPMGLDILNKESVREGMIETVGRLTADDVDTAEMDLVFSVDEVNGEFTIEQETSGGDTYYVLKSKASLDYEDMSLVSDDGTTMVTITVSDGVRSFVEDFAITIMDENDNSPVISIENLESGAIDESLTSTVVGTVSVRDDDRTEINRRIVYTSENNNFSVDAGTGEIHFTPFEISGNDLEVSTTITASDGLNIGTIELGVTIDNTDNSQDVAISEQVLDIREGELEVPTAVVATGSDISYSISATETGFMIDENTGVLSFVISPDYEDVNEREYSLLVTVMNDLSDASAMVTIRVEDVNDNMPTMLRLLDSVGVEVSNAEVVEGDVGFVLGTLMADDVDTVGTLVYSTDDMRFEIEEVAGSSVLKTREALDYEGDGVSSGTIVIQLTVSDGNETAIESLTVTITDVDDEEPMMLRLLDDVGDVVEDIIVVEGNVEVLGILTADDVDTAGEDLVYTIGEGMFMIENTIDGYVLKSKATVDYEGDGVSSGTMVIELTVSDGTTDALVESLTITITDVDDESPSNMRVLNGVGAELQNIIVVEGTEKVLGTLVASDVDTDISVHAISYVSDDTRFMIEETGVGTGIYVLSAGDMLDYEGGDVIGGITELQITMSDIAGNMSVESLRVTIEDVDDEEPMMLRLVDGAGDVVEDVMVLEGSVVVLGTLTADDVDTDAADLVYTIDDNVRFMVEKDGWGGICVEDKRCD